MRGALCAGGYRVIYEGDLDTGGSDDAGNVLVLKIYGLGRIAATSSQTYSSRIALSVQAFALR